MPGVEQSSRTLLFAAVILFFAIIFLLLASRDANRALDHDEHQFIASGKLFSQSAVIPYKSYPYFHVPNLIFVYAILFKTTSYALLSVRLFSAICATLTLGFVFHIAFHLFSGWSPARRFLLAAGTVILILVNPLFRYTSGLSWNHDLPVLLTLAAFLVHCEVARGIRPTWWIIFSGLLLGLAVGTRLSFAVAVPPFLVAIPFLPCAGTGRIRIRLLLMFSAGIVVSLLPVITLFVIAPRQFLYGNLGYPRVNSIYFYKMGKAKAMSPFGKFSYFRGVIEEPANLLLFLLFAVLMISRSTAKKEMIKGKAFEVALAIVLVCFLLIGSFAATPVWYQYFYAPVLFVVIGILYGIALLSNGGEHSSEHSSLVLKLFACVVLLSAVYGLREYKDAKLMLSPSQWTAVEVHRIGQQIRGAVGAGKVLTLSPVFPVEGGLETYPEFATGPFAWRVAPLLSESERQASGFVSPADLSGLLTKEPPTAILVGLEGVALEQPFVDYAKENGYTPLKLSDGQMLWVARPSPSGSRINPIR